MFYNLRIHIDVIGAFVCYARQHREYMSDSGRPFSPIEAICFERRHNTYSTMVAAPDRIQGFVFYFNIVVDFIVIFLLLTLVPNRLSSVGQNELIDTSLLAALFRSFKANRCSRSPSLIPPRLLLNNV